MVQKVVLDVESNRGLENYGPAHVIVYNDSKERYYVETAENFLAPQNQQIKELAEHFNELLDAFNSVKKEFEDFKTQIATEKNAFLQTYKDTNGKLIEMVKSCINKEN